MAEFVYQAKNQQGQLIEGHIEASSEEQAVITLQQQNLVILSLDQAEKKLLEKDLTAVLVRPNRKDVVIFTRQLATLIDADVPLVDGLHILSQQVEKASFKKVVLSIATDIEGGATLSIALSNYPKVFTGFYISLVRAGEVAGKLQSTLLYLADYLERSAALNSKLRGALAYPGFVLFALLIVTIIMMTTVLPQLLSIIRDAGVVDLPITTRILIATTDFVNANIIFILIGLIGAIVGGVYYFKTPEGKEKIDSFLIHMPQFGKITRNLYLARMSETLSTLIKSGVPILQGLEITSEVVGNAVYRNILLEARTSVQNGGFMSEVFSNYPDVMPAMVTSMLAIGEKTGRTDSMLENIYRFYNAEAENNIANLSQLIEPVLILTLGLGVGILVSAVLLPIYSLVGAQ